MESCFGIQIIERKGKYYEHDGREMAKEILNIRGNKKLCGLLDAETKRLINIKKKS